MLTIDLAAGLLLYTFVEYAHHRWGGHTTWLRSLRRSHGAHHRDPQEGGVRFTTKLVERAPLVAKLMLLFGAAFALVLPLAHAGVVLAGLLGGYLYSEWFHHRMHHVWPRTAVGRFLWRHHYIHHFVDGHVNYGFTSPLWDIVLFTWRREPSVAVPAHRVPDPDRSVVGIEVRARRARA